MPENIALGTSLAVGPPEALVGAVAMRSVATSAGFFLAFVLAV